MLQPDLGPRPTGIADARPPRQQDARCVFVCLAHKPHPRFAYSILIDDNVPLVCDVCSDKAKLVCYVSGKR